jgi:O-antigen ligase
MNLVQENRDKQIYIFTEGHQRLYTSAYKMFLDNKILGVGVKNYRNVCGDSKYYVNGVIACNTHPHNTYLQILTETGIIGFLFLIITIFYFCKYIFKHLMFKFKDKYYFNDFEICILSGVLIYLWPFIPTGNVFNNWLNITMILNLPLLMWSRKNLQSVS